MRNLTFSAVEILWLAQVGVFESGVSDVLCLAQVGGCKTGVSAVLFLAQVGGRGTGESDVLWLEKASGARIGVRNGLLKVQCGLLQETIEDGWLCDFNGALILPALYFFSCVG